MLIEGFKNIRFVSGSCLLRNISASFLQKPWDETMTWPLAAADVYYLIGMAYTELVNHSSALEAFSNALKINPEFSQVNSC